MGDELQWLMDSDDPYAIIDQAPEAWVYELLKVAVARIIELESR